ncbi:MAG: hypothetical protein NC293_11765 [Roseburia sp.]|nr:hypothetical protein [Roseburia sp.]
MRNHSFSEAAYECNISYTFIKT